jgi:acetyl esterase/lipase
VPYVPEGSTLQRLDVYLPADGEGPFPTILAIHSGGFRSRSKLLYRQMAGPLTESGYAVVATDYRLAPQYSYPAQVQDVFCALAWIHANHATYGLDRDRIIAMGDSAGGYLAAMLGTIETPSVYLENCPHTLPASDWLQGVVVYYGFYDFTSIDGYRASDVDLYLEPYWGAEFSEISPETLAEMSPMSWVDGSEPPFLLIHGVPDTYTPSWMSEDFAAALRDAGAEVELLLVEAEHAFRLKPLSDPANVQSLEAIGTFLAATSE